MPTDAIVLLHGLWMNGLELGVLRNRLQREHGFDVRVFSYPTLHGEAAEICRELAEFGARIGSERPVHLVGHSLGGAFVHRTLTDCPGHFRGNAVVLGSPLNGSKAALGAAQWPFVRPLLGPHVLNDLAEPKQRCWSGPNALGSIAGNRRLGTGQFFAHFDEDNDGTVAVSETIIPGLADHLVLPHSHIGMLFAEDVARQVAQFLRSGRFLKPSA